VPISELDELEELLLADPLVPAEETLLSSVVTPEVLDDVLSLS